MRKATIGVPRQRQSFFSWIEAGTWKVSLLSQVQAFLGGFAFFQ